MHGTVEPPNKGHFGSRAFVLFSKVVLWWEVHSNFYFYSHIKELIIDSMFMYWLYGPYF